MFLTGFDIAPLVPPEYATFRRLIGETLQFFLSQLPTHRQEEIVAGQNELPADAHPAERLITVMHTCPSLHKLGQVLARDHRLSPDVRCLLQTLESLEPRTPIEQIRAAVREELGDQELARIQLEPAALAEASVAVVIGFRHKPKDSSPRDAGDRRPDGVFKLLKPGIQHRLWDELELLPVVGQ